MAKVTKKCMSQNGSIISESQWITVIDHGELNVLFHPKFGCYQLDIVNNSENLSSDSAPLKGGS